ncbi:putative uncharacterized protein [Mycoplasma sp. CAG:472]|nr:putative uncharacterized protein [Mycoplasma sp. CAG:472]
MNDLIENKIENLVYEVRGVEVMLDSDLAMLYEVETKRINEAYYRNIDKFPERISWKLTKDEANNLRSQFATSSGVNNYGGRRYLPRVFTEQGIYMLATILKSSVATKVSIAIMDTFVRMRHYINYNKYMLPNRMLLLEDKVDNNTKRINQLFDMFDPKEITKEYLFFENQLFKSHYVLNKIFESAKEEIIIVDNYADKELLMYLSTLQKSIKIISKNMDNLLIAKYEKEFNNIEFIRKDIFHDRFIILDREKLFSCGSSFKDLGKKCFAINLMEDKIILNELLNKILN